MVVLAAESLVLLLAAAGSRALAAPDLACVYLWRLARSTGVLAMSTLDLRSKFTLLAKLARSMAAF